MGGKVKTYYPPPSEEKAAAEAVAEDREDGKEGEKREKRRLRRGANPNHNPLFTQVNHRTPKEQRSRITTANREGRTHTTAVTHIHQGVQRLALYKVECNRGRMCTGDGAGYTSSTEYSRHGLIQFELKPSRIVRPLSPINSPASVSCAL